MDTTPIMYTEKEINELLLSIKFFMDTSPIIYTEKEINELLLSIKFFKKVNSSSDSIFMEIKVNTVSEISVLLSLKDICTYLTINGWSFFISIEMLMYIIKETNFDVYRCLDNNAGLISKDRLEALRKVIKETTLIEVPMYLKDFPEIASWRFRINK